MESWCEQNLGKKCDWCKQNETEGGEYGNICPRTAGAALKKLLEISLKQVNPRFGKVGSKCQKKEREPNDSQEFYR